MDPIREDALRRRNALVALLAALTGEGATIQCIPADDYRTVVLVDGSGQECGRVPVANLPSYFDNAPWK